MANNIVKVQMDGTSGYLNKFKTNVKELYPFLDETALKISWLDSDGDKVRIFNEEDMLTFKLLEGRKLFVEVSFDDVIAQEPNIDNKPHDNVHTYDRENESYATDGKSSSSSVSNSKEANDKTNTFNMQEDCSNGTTVRLDNDLPSNSDYSIESNKKTLCSLERSLEETLSNFRKFITNNQMKKKSIDLISFKDSPNENGSVEKQKKSVRFSLPDENNLVQRSTLRNTSECQETPNNILPPLSEARTVNFDAEGDESEDFVSLNTQEDSFDPYLPKDVINSQVDYVSNYPVKHPNPVIKEALITLAGMGYRNQGRLFTDLLESVNGDVIKFFEEYDIDEILRL